MTTISDVDEAVRVLNATRHRGARSWTYDESCRRVLPCAWNGRDEQPPAFTPFEAVALARGLAAIGAFGPRRLAHGSGQ